MKTCSVQDCERSHYGAGLCNAHWQRHRRGADLNGVIKRRYAPGTSCSVDGCESRGKLCLGYCNAHYLAYRKYGDPLHSEAANSRRGQPGFIPHGTASGYSYHRCRCPECRRYKRTECRNARLSDPDKATRARRASYERNRNRTSATNQLWIARNYEAFNRITSEAYRRDQDATRSAASNYASRWTPIQDVVVRDRRLSIREIAYRLGRTVAAVSSRRHDLKAPHPGRKGGC